MEREKEIFDISLKITKDMINFPGDKATEIDRAKEIKKDGYNLSSVNMSLHAGTHIDAPSHFVENGKNIDDIDLGKFIGKVQVIKINNQKEITRKELLNTDIKCNKVLFKTRNSTLYKKDSFDENYVYLTYKGAEYLLKKGIRLIGIDYLSIESSNSHDFPAHKILLKNEVVIIESLNLSNVENGIYNLLAIPLKFKNCEASPVRALLYK